jgi:hypothetical protein
MTNGNLDTILEIAKLGASLGLGLGAIIVLILTWQSPKLLKVFLDFLRGVIKDWRARPKPPRIPKNQQNDKPLLGK